MANGEKNLTPAKTIGISVLLTSLINAITLYVMQEQSEDIRVTHMDITALRTEIDRKTDHRYRESDALRDFRLVEFRFTRNEAQIKQCLDHIKEHEQ